MSDRGNQGALWTKRSQMRLLGDQPVLPGPARGGCGLGRLSQRGSCSTPRESPAHPWKKPRPPTPGQTLGRALRPWQAHSAHPWQVSHPASWPLQRSPNDHEIRPARSGLSLADPPWAQERLTSRPGLLCLSLSGTPSSLCFTRCSQKSGTKGPLVPTSQEGN